MGTGSAAPWIVTLVCGASGVGKSSVAVPLARRYGVPLAEADDVVTALKALTTPAQLPMLHVWDTDPEVRTWTPERVATQSIALAEALRPGFAAVIADHLEFAVFRATVSALLDSRLSARAARLGVPVVPARPWADSLERVDRALHVRSW